MKPTIEELENILDHEKDCPIETLPNGEIRTMATTKPEYEMACVKCGTRDNLIMVAHRNKANFMVGWLFVCPECFPLISGKDAKIDIMVKP